MITRETGILNPEITPRKEVNTNFDAYAVAFVHSARQIGTTAKDARRQAIETLTFGEKMPFEFASYKSRIPMAAHWPEDDGTAYKRAADIYGLHTTAWHYGGQTLLRFLDCGYQDLERGDEAEIKIEVSRLPNFPDIQHGIQPAPDGRIPDGYEALPFAHYGSLVQTSPRRQILRRRAGRLTVTQVDTRREFALAREGIVSVHPSIDNFWDTEYEHQFDMVFGNRDAQKTIEKLIGENIRYHLFTRGAQVPDLGFLAEKPEPTPEPATVVESIDDLLADMQAQLR